MLMGIMAVIFICCIGAFIGAIVGCVMGMITVPLMILEGNILDPSEAISSLLGPKDQI